MAAISLLGIRPGRAKTNGYRELLLVAVCDPDLDLAGRHAEDDAVVFLSYQE
jgi:hypothetical protein